MLFLVTAKCGHTGFGSGFYIPITFAVNANTAKDAANFTRGLPRVKHDHKDAIIEVSKVQLNDFKDTISRNSLDPYLRVRSIQEQRRQISYDDIVCRIYPEKDLILQPDSNNCCKRNFFLGKVKIRNPHKYPHYHYCDRFSHIDDGIVRCV